jgi:hypothetical protein
MTTSFPRIISGVALFALFSSTSTFAQIPVGSSARSISTDVERSEVRVSEIIARSEDHFKRGKLNLDDNKREQARDEFDKAVDTILESGMDVRASQRLQTYYLELVERIYREEVPTQQGRPAISPGALVAQDPKSPSPQTEQQPAPQIGFRDQKFEPSPLDDLAKLVLTPAETQVSDKDVADLELAKNAVDFKFNINPLIQQFINYYQGRGRTTMENGLRRSGQFMRSGYRSTSPGWGRSKALGVQPPIPTRRRRVSGSLSPEPDIATASARRPG